MIDNITSIGVKRPLSTAQRLYALAKKAEANPEAYKYLIAMTSSGDVTKNDWVIAGNPTLIMLLGLIEVVKTELHQFFRGAANES